MYRPIATAPAAEEDEAGLDYQRCRWCGTPSYRRLLCPTCASPDLASAHSAGVGIVTRPPHSAESEVVVQLSEGFTVQGRIVGALRGSVHPGTVVRLTARPDCALDIAPTSASASTAGEIAFRLCEQQPGFAPAPRTHHYANF